MNILSDLADRLTGDSADDAPELTPEEVEAQEKKDRIAFHRAHVRNGPVKFGHTTTGQARRARQRAVASLQKKTFRKQVRAFLTSQREAMVLRGQLQAIGLIDSHAEVSEYGGHRAALWIIGKFGNLEAIQEQGLTVDLVEVAFLNALNRYETLTGQPVSEDLPEDYAVTA